MVESQSSRWQPAGRWAITNGRLILSDRVAVGQAVIIEGERILALDDEGALGDMARFDAGGHYVSPGLVDIHTHGALGHTFNEPSDVAFGAITRENARRGVTSLLATVTTGPLADMVQCIEYGEQWMRRQHAGAEVLGIHLEGPYFSLA
nr:amidohydrolase family protein [Anaerolineae bacterium]